MRNIRKIFILTSFILSFFVSHSSWAHCDSYDGPVIKDALKALETNNVSLVMKWIDQDQEKEIISLFNKTYSLKNGDEEIYQIVERHFLETLVRLHRETENAPFTGLKPAGSTKKIILLSDSALENNDVEKLLKPFTNHIEQTVREKYQEVVSLEKVKNESAADGRKYVEAYVEYTHLVEAIHDIIANDSGHSH